MANSMIDTATTEDLRVALRARDRAEVNRLATQLLDQHTPLREQWFSVAQVLVHTGEVALAISAAQRGFEEAGKSARAKFQLAHILSIVGRQEDAVKLVSGITNDQLNPIERDHFLGTCALEIGDFELARSAFERVVAAWSGSGVTWLSLAALPPVDDDALLLRLIDARASIMSTPPDSRARWHYAMGTVLDRLGRPDAAFAEFAAGAKLAKGERPYDPVADSYETETLTTEFTPAAVDQISQAVTTGSECPILVTGLPRSGTTLVEHILAGHSQVAGGGEMPFGAILRRDIGGRSLKLLKAFASRQGADDLTRLYMHLGEERFGKGRRFVDKCLSNSRDLGLLSSVLPDARIIWLRRDPLDCAWSCFRTYFSRGIEWSWSLTDIALHFREEDRLYTHWRNVLGDRLLTIQYEELAASPKNQINLMLKHVGLDPEPEVEAAHRQRRSVTTSSVAQVRRPIYQSSVGAAQAYTNHLKPFVETYAKAAAD